LKAPSGGPLEWATTDGTVGRMVALPEVQPAWFADVHGRVFVSPADRTLSVVLPDGSIESGTGTWTGPIFHLSPSPDGSCLLAIEGAHTLHLLVRRDDATWAEVAASPLQGGAFQQGEPAWRRDESGAWAVVMATSKGVQEFALAGSRIEARAGAPLPGVLLTRIALDRTGQWLAVDRNDEGVDVFERVAGSWRARSRIPFVAPISWLSFVRDRVLLTSLHEVRVHDVDGVLRAVMPAPRHIGFVRSFGHVGGERVTTLRLDQALQDWWVDDERVIQEARGWARR